MHGPDAAAGAARDASAAGAQDPLHAAPERDLEPPIAVSSAFALGGADEAAAAFQGAVPRYLYGRWRNRSVDALEAQVASLEGAEDAVATASGMAAVTGALLGHLQAGDHVVAPEACYGETSRLLRERLPRLGIEASFVRKTSPDAYRAVLRPSTRMLYVETPANPTLALTDIAALAELARERSAERDILIVADNTFATPVNQQPLALGASLSLHSMTKALGGHGDAIGGVVTGSRELVAPVRDLLVKGFGGVLAPFNAFLISRGIKTLALRQERACTSAMTLAHFLQSHPAVERVHYPGLADHPGHDIACGQMRAFGSLLAFEHRGGLEAGKKVLEAVRLIAHAVSLGDVRSLLTHPASTTAANMSAEVQAKAGISAGLLRLSVGIEDAEDLRSDLEAALQAAE